jgi:hypothetical protein
MKTLTAYFSANEETKIKYSESFIAEHWVIQVDILGDLIAELQKKSESIIIEQRKIK